MIPLAYQKAMLNERIAYSRKQVHEILDEWWAEIVEMARERHEKGYDTYVDEMYHWPPDVRLREVLEELADACVYLTSGDVQ